MTDKFTLEVVRDLNGEIESDVFVCETLKAAVQKARHLQKKFADRFDIPSNEYIEEWDAEGYLYREIKEKVQDRLIAETKDSCRMYVEIMPITEIVKEERLSKEDIVSRFLRMELGLVGDFLTDNAAALGEKYDSCIICVYSAEEIKHLIEECYDYDVSLEVFNSHDVYLGVKKYNDDEERSVRMSGLSDDRDEWIDYLNLDSVAEHILADDDLYERFMVICETDDRI